MKLFFKDNAVSVLQSDAAISSSTLTLATGGGVKFSGIPVGSKLIVTIANSNFSVTEIVAVTSVIGDVLHLLSPTTLAWTAGANVVASVTSAMANYWQFSAPEGFPYGVDSGNNTIVFDGQVSYGKYNIITSEAWQPNKTYPKYAIVTDTSLGIYLFMSISGTEGTSAASEPIWPGTIGNSVGDGTLTWVFLGYTLGYTSEADGGSVIGVSNYSWAGKNSILGNSNSVLNGGSAVGDNNLVADDSVAVGKSNIVLGRNEIAVGQSNTLLYGTNSNIRGALGNSNSIAADCGICYCVGYNNVVNGPNSGSIFILGRNNTVDAGSSFNYIVGKSNHVFAGGSNQNVVLGDNNIVGSALGVATRNVITGNDNVIQEGVTDVTVIGNNQKATVSYTNVMSGINMVRRIPNVDATQFDAVRRMAGTMDVIVSKNVNLLAVSSGIVYIDNMPLGASFYCNEVGIIFDTVPAVITTMPFISIQATRHTGDFETYQDLVASVQPASPVGNRDRVRFTNLLFYGGVDYFRLNIDVAGDAGSVMDGRFYAVGMFVED